MSMGRTDNHAKGMPIPLGLRNVFLHSIKAVNLVGTVCSGSKSGNCVNLGGAQTKVFLSRQANFVAQGKQVVGDIPDPFALLLSGIGKDSIVFGK